MGVGKWKCEFEFEFERELAMMAPSLPGGFDQKGNPVRTVGQTNPHNT